MDIGIGIGIGNNRTIRQHKARAHAHTQQNMTEFKNSTSCMAHTKDVGRADALDLTSTIGAQEIQAVTTRSNKFLSTFRAEVTKDRLGDGPWLLECEVVQMHCALCLACVPRLRLPVEKVGPSQPRSSRLGVVVEETTLPLPLSNTNTNTSTSTSTPR